MVCVLATGCIGVWEMFKISSQYIELSFIRWRTIRGHKDEVAVGWSRYCFDVHYLYNFIGEGDV